MSQDAREQARHISEVTKAYAEGKEIEFRDKAQTLSWKETPRPLWDWDQNDYRVKPEERKPREWRVIIATEGNQTFPEGYLIGQLRDDEQGKPGPHDAWRKGIVREVLPETETES